MKNFKKYLIGLQTKEPEIPFQDPINPIPDPFPEPLPDPFPSPNPDPLPAPDPFPTPPEPIPKFPPDVVFNGRKL